MGLSNVRCQFIPPLETRSPGRCAGRVDDRCGGRFAIYRFGSFRPELVLRVTRASAFEHHAGVAVYLALGGSVDSLGRVGVSAGVTVRFTRLGGVFARWDRYQGQAGNNILGRLALNDGLGVKSVARCAQLVFIAMSHAVMVCDKGRCCCRLDLDSRGGAMPELIAVSFFREMRLGQDSDDSVADVVTTAPWPEQERVLAYLASGHVLSTSYVRRDIGSSRCDESGSPLTYVTDGVFMWSSELAAFVRQHNIRLPPAFTEHMVAFSWRVPEHVDVNALTLPVRDPSLLSELAVPWPDILSDVAEADLDELREYIIELVRDIRSSIVALTSQVDEGELVFDAASNAGQDAASNAGQDAASDAVPEPALASWEEITEDLAVPKDVHVPEDMFVPSESVRERVADSGRGIGGDWHELHLSANTRSEHTLHMHALGQKLRVLADWIQSFDVIPDTHVDITERVLNRADTVPYSRVTSPVTAHRP